jgi:hypothetical protein
MGVAHDLPTVLEAVEKGITITGTAKVLGVTTQTVRNYRARWKAVDAALMQKRRELIDLSEMALRGAVLRGEPWAVTFALRTLGRDDGYGDRIEHAGVPDKPLTFTLVLRNDEADGARSG